MLSQAATGGASRTNYQIINMLRVPGIQQVALKVKIADLNRTALTALLATLALRRAPP